MEGDEALKDVNYMTRQLDDLLKASPPDYSKALKFSQGKMSKGQKSSMFYAVITAYCMMNIVLNVWDVMPNLVIRGITRDRSKEMTLDMPTRLRWTKSIVPMLMARWV